MMKLDQGWQYRIVKKTGRYLVDEPDTIYELCQVFVDENDDVVHIGESVLSADSIEQLNNHIDKMRKCLNQSILDYHTGEE
jgi:hypothetical protein